MTNIREVTEKRGSFPPKGAAGFSLVEVLIGVFWLSVALLAVTSLFPRVLLQISAAGQSLRAQALARARMEELLPLPFSQIESQGPTPVPEDAFFTYEVRVTPLTLDEEGHLFPSEEGSSKLKEVEVQVTWKGPAGRRELTLVTLVSKWEK